MHVAGKPLAEVVETLTSVLDELDHHGEAMAALHLAMAVDCLKSGTGKGPNKAHFPGAHRAPLRLVVAN